MPVPSVEPAEVLAGQVVQPGEPVGSRDDQDVAVAAVDEAGAFGQRALFAQRVAVMGSDRSPSIATAPGGRAAVMRS